ncbi:MAG: zinc ribbon domain-containing protein, partial [Anaerolineae bacterium]|nr:zinc ribbon domain-containing protein [Anaerolineae bacterium]
MNQSPLKSGIAAYKNGQRDEARRYFMQAVRDDPQAAQTWLWLCNVAQTREERRFCLERVQALDPDNALAQKGLHKLGPGPTRSPLRQNAPPTLTTPEGRPCPHCNTANPRTNRFCDQCSALLGTDQPTPERNVDTASLTARCVYCGTSNAAADRYCAACGSTLRFTVPPKGSMLVLDVLDVLELSGLTTIHHIALFRYWLQPAHAHFRGGHAAWSVSYAIRFILTCECAQCHRRTRLPCAGRGKKEGWGHLETDDAEAALTLLHYYDLLITRSSIEQRVTDFPPVKVQFPDPAVPLEVVQFIAENVLDFIGKGTYGI